MPVNFPPNIAPTDVNHVFGSWDEGYTVYILALKTISNTTNFEVSSTTIGS